MTAKEQILEQLRIRLLKQEEEHRQNVYNVGAAYMQQSDSAVALGGSIWNAKLKAEGSAGLLRMTTDAIEVVDSLVEKDLTV